MNKDKTRVRGITRSVSARRCKGDGFDARPKTAAQLKTLNVLPIAAMSDARHYSMSRENALAPNRCN